MAAGYPKHIPSSTIAQACISANQAICSGAEKILSGKADIVVAGGAETFSDVPIRFSRKMRQNLIKLPKVTKQGQIATLKHILSFRPEHLKPELPAIANYTTGEVMGVSSDRLSARFGVSRADQDRFALRSHQLAAQAHAQGLYKDEIIPVKGSTVENGIKGDTSFEKISTLSPAFIKPHGTHTAANSSFLTDGASAILLMSEEKALQLGFKPK
jgi:acetyl-CoA acyltransferase